MANRRRKRKSSESKSASDDASLPNEQEGSIEGNEGERQDEGRGSKRRKRDRAEKHNPRLQDDKPKEPLFPRLPSLSRVMSVVMLMIGILAIGALFYKVMAGFFVPLFLATLLVVIFRPVHLWIYEKVGQRPRVAALTTTTLILMIVLLPIGAVLSVATTQFTALVSHTNLSDLNRAIDRARDQLSISLPHAAQFRRLDALSNAMDAPEQPELVLQNIHEAEKLVAFLQERVEGPAIAEEHAEIALQRLGEFDEVVSQRIAHNESDDMIEKINAQERFHSQSVVASAAIRRWMRTLLGGTVRSQAKLIANPSEADFAALLKKGREALQPRFVAFTSATGMYVAGGLAGLLILVVAVYFFLLDGPSMIRTLMRLSPMDDNYERRLLMEFDRTSRAVVLASVISALVQGVLAAIAFWFFGFHSVILLFLLTSIMALVPFLGAASVWVPCALWLGAVEQRWTAAIILAIYGATIVSSIDNFIKMYVLHGRSTLHPLFALLSVFGGVKVFGPIGVLVGPMVVVFLQTLLEILNHELISTDTDRAQAEKAAEEAAQVET